MMYGFSGCNLNVHLLKYTLFIRDYKTMTRLLYLTFQVKNNCRSSLLENIS